MAVTLQVRGLAGEICEVQARSTDPLNTVKELIEGASGIPKQQQKLVLCHKTVDDLSRQALSTPLADLLTNVEHNGKVIVNLVKREPEEAAAIETIMDFSAPWDGPFLRDILADKGWVLARKDVMMAAVSRWGEWLQDASEELKADKEVVLRAVSMHSYAIQYAAPELRSDMNFLLEAVRICNWVYQHVEEGFKRDKQLALLAITSRGGLFHNVTVPPQVLEWLPECLQGDREVVHAAVNKNGLNLKFASPALRADREIAAAAANQNRNALQFIDNPLRSELERAMAPAPSGNGEAFKWLGQSWHEPPKALSGRDSPPCNSLRLTRVRCPVAEVRRSARPFYSSFDMSPKSPTESPHLDLAPMPQWP